MILKDKSEKNAFVKLPTNLTWRWCGPWDTITGLTWRSKLYNRFEWSTVWTGKRQAGKADAGSCVHYLKTGSCATREGGVPLVVHLSTSILWQRVFAICGSCYTIYSEGVWQHSKTHPCRVPWFCNWSFWFRKNKTPVLVQNFSICW